MSEVWDDSKLIEAFGLAMAKYKGMLRKNKNSSLQTDTQGEERDGARDHTSNGHWDCKAEVTEGKIEGTIEAVEHPECEDETLEATVLAEEASHPEGSTEHQADKAYSQEQQPQAWPNHEWEQKAREFHELEQQRQKLYLQWYQQWYQQPDNVGANRTSHDTNTVWPSSRCAGSETNWGGYSSASMSNQPYPPFYWGPHAPSYDHQGCWSCGHLEGPAPLLNAAQSSSNDPSVPYGSWYGYGHAHPAAGPSLPIWPPSVQDSGRVAAAERVANAAAEAVRCVVSKKEVLPSEAFDNSATGIELEKEKDDLSKMLLAWFQAGYSTARYLERVGDSQVTGPQS